MIKCYTGVPGSGKSLHSIRLILAYLKAGKNVIANFPIKVSQVKHMNGRYFYVENQDLTVDFLRSFARLFHEEERENQTLIMLDEASVKFNCREFSVKDRLPFCSFFAQHRKYGFEVVLITQNLRQIDRQIRDLCEIEVVHRKLNNFSLWSVLPFPLFVAVERNVTIREKNGHEFFLYSRKVGNLYDTFYDFTQSGVEAVPKARKHAILAAEIVPKERRPQKRHSPRPSRIPAEADDGSAEGVRQRGPAADRRPPSQETLSAKVDRFFQLENE